MARPGTLPLVPRICLARQRPRRSADSSLLYRRPPVGRASYLLHFGVFRRPADWKCNATDFSILVFLIPEGWLRIARRFNFNAGTRL